MIGDFIQNNLYSRIGGIKPAALVTGGLAAALSFISLPLGGMVLAGGLLLSPFINKALSYFGIGPLSVPGGIPDIPAIPVGERKEATRAHDAPIHDTPPGQNNTIIRSALLENITPPKTDVESVVDSRLKGITESIKLANLPAGSAPGLEERVNALWKDTTNQEREISDFVATMANYKKDQEQYTQESGEQNRLVQAITTGLGIRSSDAKSMVPELPALPQMERTWRKKTEMVDNPLFERDYNPYPSYSALYEKERGEGKLPSEYKGRPWKELDVITRQGYIFNRMNAEIVRVKSSIDVRKLNPDGGSLPDPDFHHSSKGGNPHWIQWLTGDGSEWTRKNAASVVTQLLTRDLSKKIPEWGRTGSTNGGVLEVYANAAIKRCSGHPEAIKEYKKILHYADLVKKRDFMLYRIRRTSPAVDSLVEFRKNGLEAAHQDAQQFLQTTLPAINTLIAAKQQYAEAGLTLTGMTRIHVAKYSDKHMLELTFRDTSNSEAEEYKVRGYIQNGKFVTTDTAKKDSITKEWAYSASESVSPVDLTSPSDIKNIFAQPAIAGSETTTGVDRVLTSLTAGGAAQLMPDISEGESLASNIPASLIGEDPKQVH